MDAKQRRQLRIAVALIDLATILAFAPMYCNKKDSVSKEEPQEESSAPLVPLEGITTQEQGEQELHLLSIIKKQETAWVYTNQGWYDIAKFATEDFVFLDSKKVERIFRETSGDIYFYHTHSGDVFSIYPPSPCDIRTHRKYTEELQFKGKRIVSRVVDPFEVWQYDDPFPLRFDPAPLSLLSSFESDFGEQKELSDLFTLVERIKLQYRDAPRRQLIYELVPAYKRAGIELTVQVTNSELFPWGNIDLEQKQ